MLKYPKPQRDMIDRAYSALLRIVESDHKAERMLENAYKYERRERGSQTLTQELLIDSFMDGWHGQRTVCGLFFLSEGCAAAAMLGTVARKYHDEEPNAKRFIVTESDLALLNGALIVAKEARDARHNANMASLRGAR